MRSQGVKLLFKVSLLEPSSVHKAMKGSGLSSSSGTLLKTCLKSVFALFCFFLLKAKTEPLSSLPSSEPISFPVGKSAERLYYNQRLDAILRYLPYLFL